MTKKVLWTDLFHPSPSDHHDFYSVLSRHRCCERQLGEPAWRQQVQIREDAFYGFFQPGMDATRVDVQLVVTELTSSFTRPTYSMRGRYEKMSFVWILSLKICVNLWIFSNFDKTKNFKDRLDWHTNLLIFSIRTQKRYGIFLVWIQVLKTWWQYPAEYIKILYFTSIPHSFCSGHTPTKCWRVCGTSSVSSNPRKVGLSTR